MKPLLYETTITPLGEDAISLSSGSSHLSIDSSKQLIRDKPRPLPAIPVEANTPSSAPTWPRPNRCSITIPTRRPVWHTNIRTKQGDIAIPNISIQSEEDLTVHNIIGKFEKNPMTLQVPEPHLSEMRPSPKYIDTVQRHKYMMATGSDTFLLDKR